MKIQFILPDVSRLPIGGYKIVYEYSNWISLNIQNAKVEVLHLMFRPDDWLLSKSSALYAARKFNRKYWSFPDWAKVDSRVTFSRRSPETACNDRFDVRIATSWRTAEYLAAQPDETYGRRYYFIQHFEDWGCDRTRLLNTWRSIDRKLFVAKWLEKTAIDLGIDCSQSVHVPNGIDTTRYCGEVERKTRKSIAFMYSRSPFKGGDIGISVLRTLAIMIPDLKINIFGTQEPPEALPPSVQYYRDPEQTILIEHIYGKSEIFLCTSTTEGWGLPGAEAMACGCALVSTDNGGVNDYATHGVDALIVPPGDKDSLTKAILSLLNDDHFRIRIASNGQAGIQGMTAEIAASRFFEALHK